MYIVNRPFTNLHYSSTGLRFIIFSPVINFIIKYIAGNYMITIKYDQVLPVEIVQGLTFGIFFPCLMGIAAKVTI